MTVRNAQRRKVARNKYGVSGNAYDVPGNTSESRAIRMMSPEIVRKCRTGHVQCVWLTGSSPPCRPTFARPSGTRG